MICEICAGDGAFLTVDLGQDGPPFRVCWSCRPAPVAPAPVAHRVPRDVCAGPWGGCTVHAQCVERRRAHWRAMKQRRRARAAGVSP